MELSSVNRSLMIQLNSIADSFENDESMTIKFIGYTLKFIVLAMDKSPDVLADITFGTLAKFVLQMETSLVTLGKTVADVQSKMEGGCESCPAHDKCKGDCSDASKNN